MKNSLFIDAIRQHMIWMLKTFDEPNAKIALTKLNGEIAELEAEIDNPTDNIATEYADCLMCVFSSAARAGVPLSAILDAFKAKVEVNKSRTWVKNEDGTYSHVKPITHVSLNT